MRDTTERPEAGTVKLVGTDVQVMTSAINELMDDSEAYIKMICSHNPYGDGKTCGVILDILSAHK